jgi:hypothetical protein
MAVVGSWRWAANPNIARVVGTAADESRTVAPISVGGGVLDVAMEA